jgi:NADH-quinone oxidoreductase subunit J
VYFMIIEIGDIANIIFLIATMIFIIMAIEMKNLIKASISLGIGSALLAMVFFVLGAPIAAVFELSVCAGLVTILLLSAIGMLEKEESE